MVWESCRAPSPATREAELVPTTTNCCLAGACTLSSPCHPSPAWLSLLHGGLGLNVLQGPVDCDSINKCHGPSHPRHPRMAQYVGRLVSFPTGVEHFSWWGDNDTVREGKGSWQPGKPQLLSSNLGQ